MLNLSEGEHAIRSEVVRARFKSLASLRLGRPAKVSDSRVRSLVHSADEVEIHPIKLVEWTFDNMDESSCISVFGIPYPPIEYVYSRYNLVNACQYMEWKDGTDVGRIGTLVSRMMSSEYLSKKIPSERLNTAVLTGTLSEEWVQVVSRNSVHPLHEKVSRIVEAYEMEFEAVLSGAEIDYLWECLKETRD